MRSPVVVVISGVLQTATAHFFDPGGRPFAAFRVDRDRRLRRT
jgi:hypothetical protein